MKFKPLKKSSLRRYKRKTKRRRSYKKKQYGGDQTCNLITDDPKHSLGIKVNEVCLPFTQSEFRKAWKYQIPVILTHGLGVPNPKLQSHYVDEWVQDVLIPGVKGENNFLPYIAYTSRGHGDSTGWEDTVDSNKEQFEWKNLSKDMLEIAKNKGIKTFIAAGSSIGSATALYSAIQNPDAVKGLILLRPPKGWHRNVEKKVEKGEECFKKRAGLINCKVFIGTAPSDYPPENSEDFSNIKCPVLIMTIEGNKAHPVETAKTLHKLIKQSELHIAKNDKQAKELFPDIIQNFLLDINLEENIGFGDKEDEEFINNLKEPQDHSYDPTYIK